MKKSLAPLLGIAFVVALAASGILYGVFANQLKQASERPAAPLLAVAARHLDRGTVLRDTDLKMSPWPGAAPPGAYRDVKRVVGKTLYAPMLENEPISEAQLSTAKASSGVGIAKGMRALSVRVVDSAGLMPLRPGDRVDVQAIQNRGSSQAALRTILQNVEVLSVQALPEGIPTAQASSVVTILVSPENQDRVALADSGANVRLVLRNPEDSDEVRRPNLMLASLFTEKEPLAAVPGMELLVQVARASQRGVQEMPAVTGTSTPLSAPTFAPVSRRPDVEPFLSRRIAVSEHGSTRLAVTGGFSILLKSWCGPQKTVRLQLQPELTLLEGSATSTRSVTAGLTLANGQSAMMTGLNKTLGDAVDPNLVVIVTARSRALSQP